MRDVLLVAAREFRQIVATRGFWVLLLIVPAAIAVSIFGATVFAPKPTSAFTVVDASGRYGAVITQRLELDYQRQSLRDLSAYVDRWKLARVAPGAAWARRDAWLSDAEVARFAADGGAAAALRRLAPHLADGVPVFNPPPRYFVEVAPPSGVSAEQGADAFGRAVAASLKGDIATAEGKRPLVLAVYIPRDFGAPGAVVRMWTNGGPASAALIESIRGRLTEVLRLRTLQASGLTPEAAARIQALSAPVEVSEPAANAGRARIIARSIVPLALVYLLLTTSLTTGSMMLQGLVEERSNKLLESVLACIRPGHLMYGKLLGLGAVGLAITAVWSGCAIGAAFTAPGFVADLLRPSLEALDKPWIVAAMIFYFLTGYVITSMLFLAIGSLSDSMQDAQSYLMPVMLVVLLPVMLVMQVTVRDPDAAVIHVLSWIPLYTPFAMLARMGAGIPIAEMVGTGAILVAFVALELLLLGRVFRASLLSAGQPASARLFARLIFSAPDR